MFERGLQRLKQKCCGQALALDTGNTSGGGGLLSSFFGLVGLKYSDGLIHLENIKHEVSSRSSVHETMALSPVKQVHYCASNWPLSAGTRVTPACAGAPSCRSPATCQWSCQPGWGACSGSGGTDARLKSTNAEELIDFWKAIFRVSENHKLWRFLATHPASASVPEEGQPPAWMRSEAPVLARGQQAEKRGSKLRWVWKQSRGCEPSSSSVE